MRIWFDTDRLTSLNLAPSDVVQAIQAQNVQAPVGRIGARPIAERPAVPAQRADPGPADHRRAVRQHRAARQPGRLGAADARRRAGRAGRADTQDTAARLNGQPAVGDRASISRPAPTPCDRRGASRKHDGRAARRASPRASSRTSSTTPRSSCSDTISEVLETLVEAFVLVVHRRLPVPRQPARHDHPDRRRAGQPDRHLRRPAGARLLGQHRLAARAGAGDRHRGRRRHRRGRERRAGDARSIPSWTPPRRPRRRWRRSPRRSSPSPWCCCRCSCRSPSSPASRASCSASSRSTISVAMLISAINALTLSPALCAHLPAPRGRRRAGRSMGRCARHRLRARRLCRASCGGWSASR